MKTYIKLMCKNCDMCNEKNIYYCSVKCLNIYLHEMNSNYTKKYQNTRHTIISIRNNLFKGEMIDRL
jgi:hypothetical protein